MSLFEYLVIAFALLYASAAMRLIGGLMAALDPRRRYWVHLGFVFFTLLVIAFNFWSFWSLNTIDWTLPKFLFALLIPATLYFCASTLIPENPEDIRNWRDHYFAVRTRYFSALALWFLLLSGVGFALLQLPLLHPARIGHIAGMAIAIIGMISDKHRIHAALMMTALILIGVISLTAGIDPAWLSEST